MIRVFLASLLACIGCIGCNDVSVSNCVNGANEIEAAALYAAEHWPDAAEQASYLLVSCKDQHTIETSISSCAAAPVRRPESCAVHRVAPGRRARIDVSHDEDAAISTCHELQHLRDAVWFTDEGCQSHSITCNYDETQVDECEEFVRQQRAALDK